ncbi:polyprenol phosphomannose-dependent alpha 1,6 mannosyltransferase MptB [Frankia tisae]|uniref:polyprenol phosphomannose-dependent alpha 1,6 mannosyltransferase MptB n=1 Tax=Frankia tisae TaxID=2950104 RepID=UPI0021BE6D66|nr:polyprenol phosphomannose-dependent alpha 1,6 mannosyltransferase MptB [Frankia tisae]
MARGGRGPSANRASTSAIWLIIGGTGAAVAAMLAEGRLGPRDPYVTDPSSWLGILPSTPTTETARGVLAGMSALSVITLCLCWALLVGAMAAGRVSTRAGLAAAVAWSLPFAVGPPLFSRDVYAYAAQGELARLGLDPATHGVATLLTAGAPDGSGRAFVRAVDPRWWHTHTPYGGAAVAVEKAAAAIGGGPAGTVVVLRVVAVLATIAMIGLSLRLAGSEPTRRQAVAVLVAANPVVVIHLVGSAHLDAIAAMLVVAALVVDRATRRATGPHPQAGNSQAANSQAANSGRAEVGGIVAGAAATGLACLAGNVKATALLCVGWLVLAHLLAARRAPRPLRAGAVRLTADVVAVAVASGLSIAAAGFGPTWIRALSTSGAVTTGIAPASILATAADGVLALVGVHPADGTSQRVTRALCLAAAAAVVLALALRAWRRTPPAETPPVGTPPVGASSAETSSAGTPPAGGDRAFRALADHRPDLVVVGFGGLAVALGNPVVYPWYLALCLAPLAVLAARGAPAGRRGGALAGTAAGRTAAVLVLASTLLCVATLPPLAATWRLLGTTGVAALVTVAALALAAGAATALLAPRRRPAPPTNTP